MNPTDCIIFQMVKAGQGATRFWVQKVAKLNVTAVQAMVLGFLYNKDRVSSKELGDRALLDSATLTGIIDRLESVGFVRREQNRKDRRAILITLTDEGRRIGENIKELMIEANRDFLTNFSDEEEVVLRGFLDRIRADNR